jgi:hypothetical protein
MGPAFSLMRLCREPVIAIDIAKQFGAELLGGWIKTSVDVALQRNASRPMDERAQEESIRSVAGLFEAPTRAEGFEKLSSSTLIRANSAKNLLQAVLSWRDSYRSDSVRLESTRAEYRR